MPSTSWICGSVCSTKFFGEPPPSSTTPLLPPCCLVSKTMAAVSLTSTLGSSSRRLPLRAIAATFMPIELSPGFFFQAEDGIRYHCVTGVQTCALPIFDALGPAGELLDERARQRVERRRLVVDRD